MKALLYHDFLTLWKQMKLMVVMVVLFCLIPNSAFDMNNFFVVYAAVLFPMGVMAYDERAKWDVFSRMLPYSLRDIVRSRYVFAWTLTLGAALVNLAGRVFFRQGQAGAEATAVVWLLAGVLLFQAVLFPYLFRMGAERGRTYLILFILILAVVFGGAAAVAEEVFPHLPTFLAPTAPVALLAAFLLCLASTRMAEKQLVARMG